MESLYSDRIDAIDSNLKEFSEEVKTVGTYWAGDWVEYSNYYNNFINNNGEQHIQLTYDSLVQYTENKVGKKLSDSTDEMKSITEQFKSYNQNLLTELSILKGKDEFSEQLALLNKLETFEWGLASFKIVESQKPKKIMASYGSAQRLLSKGIETPPHIGLSSELLSNGTCGFSIKEYIKHCKRLLREVELIVNMDNDEFIGLDNPYTNLQRVFDKFHSISRQLINRHAGRTTIEINDEYDVQDLLHALLKIYFDDVRPEEYTPSYAGRNTRLDFLLKKERIVVEVKKTRNGLKDREVGDELLQDIARYKNHPDCDTLFCFVYDPQSLIQNPRGLEDDLANESSEKLKVFVVIRP